MTFVTSTYFQQCRGVLFLNEESNTLFKKGFNFRQGLGYTDSQLGAGKVFKQKIEKIIKVCRLYIYCVL